MKITSLQDFYADALSGIGYFDAFVAKHSLVSKALPDHICYKCETKEVFEFVRSLLEKESVFMYQSIISQRRIAYAKFKRPFETALGPIYFLELSDQKPDGSQESKFDHIEVYPTTLSYEEFVSLFHKSEEIKKIVRPHHTTHDVEIGGGFLFRCTEGPLLEKIKASEMV